MKRGINFKELNAIKSKILEEVKTEDKLSIGNIKTIAGFSLIFKEDKIICVGIILDFNTLEILEEKTTENEITMNYQPDLIAFREGTPIINTIKEFSNKPDILMINGNGIINEKKLGVATYVGVMSNIPAIGVSKKLIFGNLEVDKIMFKEKQVGIAIKAREYANPVYVTPGNDLSIESAKLITEKVCKNHKLPLPLHKAHKVAIKSKQR